jgi:hypothetical protein
MRLRSSCARAGILDPASQIGRSASGSVADRRQMRRSGAITTARLLDVRAQMICAHLLASSACPERARSAFVSGVNGLYAMKRGVVS